MKQRNYKYHIEMVLNELKEKNFIKDTRGYLSLDREEQSILIRLLEDELDNVHK